MKNNKKTHYGNTSTGMLSSVLTFVFAVANLGITKSIKAWEALMLMLQANLQSINNLYVEADKIITGKADQKRTAKSALVELSAAIMSSVYDYAIKTKNDDLAAQMKTRRSTLSRKPYRNLITFTEGAIQIVTPLIAKLVDYNINQALIDQWQASNKLLSDLLSAPNSAIGQRKAINEQIQELIRTSVIMLTEQADRLALNFRNNPATEGYYRAYLAQRKLKPNHVSTQLRATVFNGEMPVANVIVSLTDTDFKSVTDANGYCLLDGLPYTKTKTNEPLTQTVTVTIDTVSKVFGPYRFKKGKSLTQRFDMQAFDMPASKVQAKQMSKN